MCTERPIASYYSLSTDNYKFLYRKALVLSYSSLPTSPYKTTMYVYTYLLYITSE